MKLLLWLFSPVAIAHWCTLHLGGGGSNTTTVQKSFTPEEEAIRRFMLEQGRQAFNQLQPQLNAGGFPGAAPIPASPQTQQARQQLQTQAAGVGQQIADATSGAIQFGLKDVLFPSTNPALQSTIDTATRQVGQQFTDPGGVIQRIRDQFTAGSSGGASTRESIAGGLAGRSFLDTIGDVTGRIASQGFGQGLDAFTRTLGLAPGAAGLTLQPAQTLATVGGSIEAEQQAAENFEAQKRGFALNAPFIGLQNLSQIFNANVNPATQTSANAASNPALAAAGGALTGATLGSSIAAGTSTGASAGGAWGAAIGAIAGLLLS